MINQLKFLPIILEGVAENQQLYAADILIQIYNSDLVLSVKDILSFFRYRQPLLVWETIMTLLDLGYIKDADCGLKKHCSISDLGVTKVQMIFTCLQTSWNYKDRNTHLYRKK